VGWAWRLETAATDGGVLVEGVGGVGGEGCGQAARATLEAVADAVVLVGAVVGVGVAVGFGDFACGVVAPCPARGGGEGGAAGADSSALADGIHAVVIAGNDAGANLVLFEFEHIAVGGPGVVDIVDGTCGGGDGLDEVAVLKVVITEGGAAIGDGLETTGGGMVSVGGLGFGEGCWRDARASFEFPAGIALEGITGAVDDAGEFGSGCAVEVVGDGFGVEGEGGGIVE
jgi:hypothetical protein